MAHLIDKSALVAEIEKRIRACGNCYVLDELTSLYSSINNLETKEVDLKKEVKRWKNEHGVYGMDDLDFIFAKHFFELGMTVGNKAQKGE